MTIDLAADAAIFGQDFGETIRFRANSDAEIRTITDANVYRDAIEDDSDAPFAGKRSPTLQIGVKPNAVTGIAASDVVDDVSLIKVAFPEGATPRWRPVLRVLSSDPGYVMLEVKL